MEHKNSKETKAVVLMSGGLDSTLAARMLMEQNIKVKGVFFNTGFCIQAQKKRRGEETEPDVIEVAKSLNINLQIIDISEEFIPLISNPKFGWGKNINPCTDCRIFMLQKAKEYAQTVDADFIATGEVIGQRPKSQKKHTQFLIEKEAGLKGELLRPLSAKLLPATVAETNGLVDRSRLQNFSGRSRKGQLALAKKWEIGKTAAVAGGCCFLTDKTYANRFKDLIRDRFEFLRIDKKTAIDSEQVVFLGTGRHIKIRPGLKMIVGRNFGENNLLEMMAKNVLMLFSGNDIPGPTSFAQILASHSEVHPPVKLENIWQTTFTDTTTLNKLADFIERNAAHFSFSFTKEELYLMASLHARYMDKDTKENKELPIHFVLLDEQKKSLDELVVYVPPFTNQDVLRSRMLTATSSAIF